MIELRLGGQVGAPVVLASLSVCDLLLAEAGCLPSARVVLRVLRRVCERPSRSHSGEVHAART